MTGAAGDQTPGYQTSEQSTPAADQSTGYPTTGYQTTDYQSVPTTAPTEATVELTTQPLTTPASPEPAPVVAPSSTAVPIYGADSSGYHEDLIVHSQRNCLLIDPGSMSRLQNEVAVSRQLQPGLYTIKLKSGAFDYRIDSGHSGEPIVLLWIYGGRVVNQRTGNEVGATWSSLNGYGDTLTLRVVEPAMLCGFYFDTYLDDNEGEVVISVEGAGHSEELTIHSKYNCYFIDPDTMRRLEQEISVSRVLQPGSYFIRIKSGSFSYQHSNRQGEPIVLLWIYGGRVMNQQTGVEVAATWSSLNGYSDLLRLEVREPATICAFFFDSYIEDNQGEIVLSVTRIRQ